MVCDPDMILLSGTDHVPRYHNICLEVGRKRDANYICPICDRRFEFPRSVTRPSLEDLETWQAEIGDLASISDEKRTLANIINNAQAFRTYLAPLCRPIVTSEDAEVLCF